MKSGGALWDWTEEARRSEIWVSAVKWREWKDLMN